MKGLQNETRTAKLWKIKFLSGNLFQINQSSKGQWPVTVAVMPF
jgi:hypothetical protein